MITLLSAAGLENRLAKTLTLTGEGTWHKQSYDHCEFFHVYEEKCSSIDDLSAILTAIESDPHMCVIRGRRKLGAPDAWVRRRIHDRDGEKAVLEERACEWIMLDVDGREADPNWSNAERLKRVIATLPACFHDVSYHYQWSNQAGLDGWKTLRVHLWFWLDTWSQVRCSKLKEQVVAEGWPVDVSVINAAQVHYTAAPVFVGCDDPLAGLRSGLVRRGSDTVDIHNFEPVEPEESPAISVPEAESQSLAASLRRVRPSGNRFEAALAAIGPDYHLPILTAAATYVARQGTDLAYLRERLIEAIQAGSPGRNSKSDYLDDRYLSRVIDGAVAKFSHSRRRHPLGF